jgi:hypothetical protein
MAGALAIASVTAVLQDLLRNGLITNSEAASIGDVNISALPPDRIAMGAEESTQLNLFMYRVAPHSGLRNSANQKVVTKKETQPDQPRLALDLFYLLTAYGAQDFHAEILLGCAMQLLHKTPVLSQDMIGTALGSTPIKKGKRLIPPAQAALSASSITDQVEQIKITPQFLSFEEMSRVWSALQARYRPSICYQVSAVVIDGS